MRLNIEIRLAFSLIFSFSNGLNSGRFPREDVDFANFQHDATGYKPCDWNSPCMTGYKCQIRAEISPDRFYCYPINPDYFITNPPDYPSEVPGFGTLPNYFTTMPPPPQIVDSAVDTVDKLQQLLLDKDKAFREKIDMLNDMQCPDREMVSTCQPCASVNDCGQGLVCCPNADRGRSCALPRDSPASPTRVIQLIEGSYRVLSRTPNVIEKTGSVALVRSQGLNILVDTGSAKQESELQAALDFYGLTPDDMYTVILTHGHPDHYGNAHHFGVPQIFGKHRVSGNIFIRSDPTSDNRTYLCTRDAYILPTPGHTSDDVSLIVENVAGFGTVAIVGDLFFYESDRGPGAPWVKEAFYARRQQQNRIRVICTANAILPGHGSIFEVTNEMKRQAGCYKVQ